MAAMISPRIIEHTDHWQLPLTGLVVTRLLLDHALSIELLERETAFLLRIGNNFVLRGEAGALTLSSERPAELGPALALLHATVRSAKAHKSGRLELELSSGVSVLVNADPLYEAWEFAGPNQMRVVCAPGGELSVWHASGPTLRSEAMH